MKGQKHWTLDHLITLKCEKKWGSYVMCLLHLLYVETDYLSGSVACVGDENNHGVRWLVKKNALQLARMCHLKRVELDNVDADV